ncbi:MAG: ABC transporter permease [Endomicrobiales bacterium]
MILSLKLAWRNVLRNKRRTVITGIAIGVGLASLIIIDALIIGMNENLVRTATSSFLGEGQIHAQGFRDTEDAAAVIHNLDRVVRALGAEPQVRRFTLRTLALGMVTSAANVSAVSLVGVNPETEQYLSEVDDTIAEGNFFKDGKAQDIVIGARLAENLEVEPGDRVVATVAMAGSGDLSQEMFRVSGIYRFGIEEMDRGMAFIRLDRAQAMLGIPGQAHEIALAFTDPQLSRDECLPFWQKYSQDGNEALGWTKLMPQLKGAIELSSFSVVITAVFLFGIIVFGIVNTLFMSLYERMFEFGVLRAVGTRPFGIARLIIFEAGFLSLVSIVLGIALGFGITYYLSRAGINYGGIEYAGVTFRDRIYPVLEVRQFIIYPFWVFVFTLLVSLYPALYAARMSPVEAMRRSM